MKKKIYLAITKGIWGGAQEYVYTLATSLPPEEFDVAVICGEGNTLQEKLQARGVRVIPLPHLQRDISIVKEIKSFVGLVRLLRADKPDVLHTNSSKMGYLGAIAGRIARVPRIVFTIHGWAFNESRPWWQRWFFYCLQWKTIFWSHVAIAVSEKTKQDARGMWFVQNKIKVVHNGLAPIEFLEKSLARASLIEKVGTVSSDIMIGTIAELHPNKGLDLLVAASKNLPQNVALFIIGEGQEKTNLTIQIKKTGLESRVFLTGRIDSARQYLKAFDIFTLTSRTEALPYTLLEAGQAGCAVLASNVGGIPEIIENGTTGILVEPNTETVEKGLTELLLNSDKRQEFEHNLKKKVETEFSVEQMIEKTKKIYIK